MHKDVKTAVFTVQNNTVTDIRVIEPEHMPLGTYSDDIGETLYKFKRWLKTRMIQEENKNYRLMEKFAGKSIPETVFRNNGASLTDCYWFKDETENKKWIDVNYYDNDFSSAFFDYILGNAEIADDSFNSPDLQTGGDTAKAWIKINGIPVLVKYGIENDRDKVMLANEVSACEIADVFGIANAGSLPVFLEGNQQYASAAESFIKDNSLEYVSLKQLSEELSLTGEEMYGFIAEMGFKEQTDQMMFMDLLVGNSRNNEDFGFIRNADTLEIIDCAPIFDLTHSFGIERENIGEQPNLFGFNREYVLSLIAPEIEGLPDISGFKDVVKENYEIFGASEEDYNRAVSSLEINYEEIERAMTLEREEDMER